MTTITPAQERLVEYYCNKSALPLIVVMQWLEQGKVTITEIANGILGEKVLTLKR